MKTLRIPAPEPDTIVKELLRRRSESMWRSNAAPREGGDEAVRDKGGEDLSGIGLALGTLLPDLGCGSAALWPVTAPGGSGRRRERA